VATLASFEEGDFHGTRPGHQGRHAGRRHRRRRPPRRHRHRRRSHHRRRRGGCGRRRAGDRRRGPPRDARLRGPALAPRRPDRLGPADVVVVLARRHIGGHGQLRHDLRPRAPGPGRGPGRPDGVRGGHPGIGHPRRAQLGLGDLRRLPGHHRPPAEGHQRRRVRGRRRPARLRGRRRVVRGRLRPLRGPAGPDGAAGRGVDGGGRVRLLHVPQPHPPHTRRPLRGPTPPSSCASPSRSAASDAAPWSARPATTRWTGRPPGWTRRWRGSPS